MHDHIETREIFVSPSRYSRRWTHVTTAVTNRQSHSHCTLANDVIHICSKTFRQEHTDNFFEFKSQVYDSDHIECTLRYMYMIILFKNLCRHYNTPDIVWNFKILKKKNCNYGRKFNFSFNCTEQPSIFGKSH